MLVVGLTGGICSGKSTVAHYFSQLGVAIIDSDIIAREVVEPHEIAYEKIIDHFGKTILNEDLTLNRQKLSTIIFNDVSQKKWLEKLLHPLIIEKMKGKIKQVHSPYCILVIPLLIETNSFNLVDRILLVDTTEEQQIKRAMQRNHLSEKDVKKIIQTQAKREERIAHADDLIDNTSDKNNIAQQVEKMHAFYLSLAYKDP